MFKKYHFNSNSASCGPCQEPAPQIINTSNQCNRCNNNVSKCGCNQLANFVPPHVAPTCQEGLILTTTQDCKMAPLAPVEGRPLTGIVNNGKIKWGVGDAINLYKLEQSVSNPYQLKLTSGSNTVSTVTIPASASPIQSISLNNIPVAPNAAGNVNIQGAGSSPVQSVSLNGTPVTPSNNGNVNLLVSGGTNGINSITEGFGITANTVAGATTIGVNPADWGLATTNNGIATANSTLLLGIDGSSYKLPEPIDKDQGEIYLKNFFPGNFSSNSDTTYTWVCPADVTRVKVKVIGGGASGNMIVTSNYNQTPGMIFHTGTCGSTIEALVPVVPGQSYPITVGGGGSNTNIFAQGLQNAISIGSAGKPSIAFGITAAGGKIPSQYTWIDSINGTSLYSARHDLNLSSSSVIPNPGSGPTGIIQLLEKTENRYFTTLTGENFNLSSNGIDAFRFTKNTQLGQSFFYNESQGSFYFESIQAAGLPGANVLVDSTITAQYGITNSLGYAGLVSIEFTKGHGLII